MKTIITLTVTMILSAFLSGTAQEKTQDNLILLPVQNDPTVSFRIWFKVGSQNDPAGKEGLAAITAAMVSDGSTKTNTYEQVLDKLFPLASGYSGSASTEMTIISGRTHKDNLNDYYPLLAEAILEPAFKQEDLDRIKSQVLNQLENTLRYASDEELGKAVLYNSIFDGTPYGHIAEGTVEAIKSITLDDIRKFYEQHYTRDNLSIGLGGGFDGALVNRLKKDLSTLPAGMPKSVPRPEPKALNGIQVTIVEKDAPATAISMGFPIDLLRGTKEWYALAIANSWLGEHRNSSSHLYQVIREGRGLNYGDYSYIENFPNGGRLQMPPQNVARRKQIFEMWIRPVPHEARHFALRAALRAFRNLVDGGMTESQFSLTRGFLKKYVLHYAPTTMERLGYAIDDQFYVLNGSHLERFRKMMDEVTLADVNAAVKKHWQYSNVKIAIVTKDAASLKDALMKDLPSPITYSSPKSETILQEDKDISTFPLGIKPENIRLMKVEDLFVK
ncbi:MAG: M16 family metallopeptidase [Bacteroidota bacterium]